MFLQCLQENGTFSILSKIVLKNSNYIVLANAKTRNCLSQHFFLHPTRKTIKYYLGAEGDN